jgi:FkbM family methyltransferase
MLIFDIGANIGRWAIANQSKGTIVSVEASETTHGVLKRVVASYPNIIPLQYAVCDSTEPFITFYECDAHTISTINENWLAHPSSRFYNQYKYRASTARVISLDKLIAKYGVPDLLKIDVEAGEYQCICSLTQKVPVLCFEWATEVNPLSFQCMDYLATLGFTQFYIQFGDDYTFEPTKYPYSLEEAKNALLKTTPKVDWGMIWCK